MHVAIDDHSRVVYVEALPDEKGGTTAAFLERALAFYRANGVTVRCILTDNGGNYRSQVFADMAKAHAIKLKRTRPYRPQTNGKTVHTNPATRMGLLTTISVQPAAAKRAATLHQLLQSSTTTRRYRRGSTHLQTVNNLCGKYS